jgi:hypothetical protein
MDHQRTFTNTRVYSQVAETRQDVEPAECATIY